jgi:cyclopropane fatty-acyl-phospholipid synthase-like methyltransferase
MSLIYQLLYRIGFLPWDSGEVPVELRALAENSGVLPPGRALDLGCGTGTQAVYLATRGWQVTAIDNVERALRRARDRAAAQDVTVSWVNADVSLLADLGLAPGFTLVFDRGCYHGLDQRQRDAYAAAVTELAAPGATLLMWAMAPNHRPLEPAGADAAEIRARFGGWEVSAHEQVEHRESLPGSSRGWHRLTRR